MGVCFWEADVSTALMTKKARQTAEKGRGGETQNKKIPKTSNFNFPEEKML